MPRYLNPEESDAEEESNQNDEGEVYPPDVLTDIDPAVEPHTEEHSKGPASVPDSAPVQPDAARTSSNPPSCQLEPPVNIPSTPPHASPSAHPGSQPSPSTPSLSPSTSPSSSSHAADTYPGPAVAPGPVSEAGKAGILLNAPDPSPSPQVIPLKQHGDHSTHSSHASGKKDGEEDGPDNMQHEGAVHSNHSSHGAHSSHEHSDKRAHVSSSAHAGSSNHDRHQTTTMNVFHPDFRPQSGAPDVDGAHQHFHPPSSLPHPYQSYASSHYPPAQPHNQQLSLQHHNPHFYASQPTNLWCTDAHYTHNPRDTAGGQRQGEQGTGVAHSGAVGEGSHSFGGLGMSVGASPLQHPRANGGRRNYMAFSSTSSPVGWRSPMQRMGSDHQEGAELGGTSGLLGMQGAMESSRSYDGSEASGHDHYRSGGHNAAGASRNSVGGSMNLGGASSAQGGGGSMGAGMRASVGNGVPPLLRHQMASIIQSSIEFGHAAQRIQDLHAHIETLTNRLMTATSERDKAENALVQLARQHQAEERRLRDKYEAQLKQQQQEHTAQAEALERDLIELKLKVERLQEHGAKGKVLGRGSEIMLTGEELQGLRAEMAQQEVLIQGYQQENVAAMQRIKELEAELKDAAWERMRMALQHDPAGIHHHLKTSTKETAARLSEILTIQKELEALREASAAREAEMKEQLDKLRFEKKQLEAKQGGVDLKQMQDGDSLVHEVQAEMEAMRAQYQGVVAELQAKVSWYAENQELLSRNDALVREQQDIISQLEHRLTMHEGPLSKSSASRVQELQAQVAALQKAAKARAPPNSLAAVIEAAKPSAEESSRVQELQSKLQAVTAKLASKDEEYEMQLRTYQQQYEQLKATFERERSRMESSAGVRKREKELMAQVEEQRSTYTRKIRDLEAKLKKAHSPSSSQAGGPTSSRISNSGGDSLVAAGQLRQQEAEVARLKAELEKKTKQIAQMHLRLGEAEARVVHLGEDLRSSVPGSPLLASSAWVSTPKKLQGQHHAVRESALYDGRAVGSMQELQQRYIAALEEAGNLRQQLSAANEEIARLQASPPQECLELQQQLAKAQSEAAASLKRAEATDLALATVQRAHSDAVERCALISAEHQRSLLRIADEAAYKEDLKWQERLAAAEARGRSAQARAEALAAELADVQARARAGWSPSAAEFLALERRLDEMGREAAAREARWQGVMEETHGLYSMQAETAQRRWELALEAKNAEIGTFKLKVQELLEAAARFQLQQQPRPMLA